MKECDLSDIIIEVFNIMLHEGMTYYFIKEQNGPLLNIIDREMRVFSNMLEVVHLWNSSLGKVDKKIVGYLQYNRGDYLNLNGANLNVADLERGNLNGANLRGADLFGANLRRANLNGADLGEANLNVAELIGAELFGANLNRADLDGADLSGAYLSGANLNGANLSKADLSGADLRVAKLNGANLSETNLSEAIFDESHVNMLYKKYDLSDIMVWISEADEIVSYKEYCIRRQRK